MKFWLWLFVLCTSVCAAAEEGDTADLHARVDVIKRKWRSVTADELRSPHNTDVVAHLRERALNNTDWLSPALLLRIDHPEIVKHCLERLAVDASTEMAFILAANPRLIVPLGAVLFREESAKSEMVVGGSDAPPNRPPSVLAARVIRELIVSTKGFTPEVIEWATKVRFDRKDGEEGRRQIRDWFTQNKTALDASDFAAVRPPG